MKIILVDPNLVGSFLGNNFLILIMVRNLENNYFLMRTKLGYLQYIAIFCQKLRHLFNSSSFIISVYIIVS